MEHEEKGKECRFAISSHVRSIESNFSSCPFCHHHYPLGSHCLRNMTPPASFTNLIRFLDENGTECYGDVTGSALGQLVGIKVPVFDGDIFSLRETQRTAVVQKVSRRWL